MQSRDKFWLRGYQAKLPERMLLGTKTYITILHFVKTFEVERNVIDKEVGALHADASEAHWESVHIFYVLIWGYNLNEQTLQIHNNQSLTFLDLKAILVLRCIIKRAEHFLLQTWFEPQGLHYQAQRFEVHCGFELKEL